jgi:hypothetical protein
MKRNIYIVAFILTIFGGCNGGGTDSTDTDDSGTENSVLESADTGLESEIVDESGDLESEDSLSVVESSEERELLSFSDIVNKYGSPRASLEYLLLFKTVFDISQDGVDYCLGISSLDGYVSLNSSGTLLTFLEDLSIGTDTISKGSTINFSENGDEVELSINGTVSGEDEVIEFNNYRFVEYYDYDWESDTDVVYSYPISGDIYISSGTVNGYFSVDESFDHANSPTVLEYGEDYCYPIFVSGEEHYLGDSSSAIWSVTAEDECQLEVTIVGTGVENSTIQDSCY